MQIRGRAKCQNYKNAADVITPHNLMFMGRSSVKAQEQSDCLGHREQYTRRGAKLNILYVSRRQHRMCESFVYQARLNLEVSMLYPEPE